MLKRRIINIRVTFAIFCGLMVGILFPYLLFKNITNIKTLILVSLLFLLITIGFWVYAEITHKYNLKIEYREKVSPLIKGACIGFIISFVAGIVLMFRPIFALNTIVDYQDNQVKVSGIVTDYVQEESTHKKFIVDNCIITIEEKEQLIDYKIYVYTTKFVEVELGDEITFETVLDKYDFLKDSDFSKLIQKIGYTTFLENSQISLVKGHSSLKDNIKQKTKDILDSNLNQDNSGIFYAVLFGDKQGLSDNLSEMFSYAGISHILAVSGLHIGVLVSLIYYSLKKLKINKYVRVVLLGAILLFYSYLCSFTPSVCRASIMAICVALCDVFMIEYDPLSGLSIAGIIVLLINPLSLFSISFQLSFLCVFSIISLAPTITKLFNKIKLPKFISTSLAISIATNLAILPVCLNAFTEVSLLGVITNILVLPIFSIAYILVFIIVVIAFMWNAFGSLLVIPNLFLQIIKTIANYITSINFGIFKVFNITYWALFLVVIVSLVIHFLMVHKFIKGSISIVIIITIITLFISSSIPNNYTGTNLIFNLKYNSNLCYYVKDNRVTLIGSNIDNYLLKNELKKLKISKITNIIAYDFQLNELDNFINNCNDFEIENIYIPSKFNYSELQSKIDNIKFFDSNIVYDNMEFNTINLNNQIIAVHLQITEIGSVLIPEIKPTKAEAKYLQDNYANVDFIYLNSDNINIDLNKINTKLIITNEVSSNKYIELEEIETYIINQQNVGVST